MPSFTQLKNRLIASFTSRFPALAHRIAGSYSPRSTAGEIPWTPLNKPIEQCRVALVTTAGIHHRAQPPFNMQDPDGDPTWRELDGTCLFDDFLITHDYYDHRDAERDPNIILPLDRLRELVAEGRLRALARIHYSFMGHIDKGHIATLVECTAPQVASRLKKDQVDLVLLTPA